MKAMRSLVVVLFIATFSISIQAQEKLANALLWEIVSPDSESSSYLFGTIHMIEREDFFLCEPLKTAIVDADKVVFEINMESMDDMSVMMGMLMNAFMANDTSLQDLLSEEEFRMVEEHFAQMGLPMLFLQRIKPLFLSALAGNDFNFSEGNPLADGSTVSYEMEIMKVAQEHDKSFDGLESVEFQMSVFDSIPYQAQAKMLVESIKGTSSEGTNELDSLVQLYKAQDLNEMEKMFQSDQSGLGSYEDLLLNTRNRNWIPIMKKMMESGSILFAVGAGHLVGDNGVIRLLEAEGFTLTPVPFSWPDN